MKDLKTNKIVKNRRFFALFLMFLCCVSIHAQYKVVGEDDGAAVAYATIHAENGTLLGLTDEKGIVPQTIKEANGTITIRQIGYQTTTIDLKNVTDGIIKMRPAVHNMNEIVVSSQGKEYIRIRGYYRNFMEENGKLCYFQQGVEDCYFKLNGKSSKSTRVQSSIHYSPDIKLKDNGKLPNVGKLFSALSITTNGRPKINIYNTSELLARTDSMLTDSISHTRKARFHIDGQNKTISMSIDTKDFYGNKSFNLSLLGKLIGLKQFHIEGYKKNQIYKRVEGKGFYTVRDLLSESEHLQLLVKEKKDIKSRNITWFGEKYIIDYELLSKDEMKEKYKNTATSLKLKTPDDIPTLPTAYVEALKTMKVYEDK